jgi:hypothetical protein
MVKGLELPNILVQKTEENSSWVPQFGDEKRLSNTKLSLRQTQLLVLRLIWAQMHHIIQFKRT